MAIAQQIVEKRLFNSLSDLIDNVEGIGLKRLAYFEKLFYVQAVVQDVSAQQKFASGTIHGFAPFWAQLKFGVKP